MNKQSKLIIVIIVALILIVGAIFFIIQINKPKAEVPQIITQIQTANENIVNLVKENETFLAAIQDYYQKNQIREALDTAVTLKDSIQKLTDISLQLTEQLKEAVVVLPDMSANVRSVVEQAIQYEIAAMNHLITYSAYKEILTQQIGIQYEAMIEGRSLEQLPDINNIIKQMQDLLTLIQGNIQSARDLFQTI
jgi:predicted PurR-regulated permease PerM